MRKLGLKVTQLMRGDDTEACLLGSLQGMNDNMVKYIGQGLVCSEGSVSACSCFFLMLAFFCTILVG